MGLTWRGHELVVVGVTPWNTLQAHMVGSNVGVEINPLEHGLYPDVLNPGTLGCLITMWSETADFAILSIFRSRLRGKGKPTKQHMALKLEGIWGVVADTGSQIIRGSGDHLGVAIGEALCILWDRIHRFTPVPIPALNLLSPRDLDDTDPD